MDGFPLVDFLTEEYGMDDGEWEPAMLGTIRGMALLRQVEFENHIQQFTSDDLSHIEPEERNLYEAFKKRYGLKGKKLQDSVLVRHLELALLLALLLGKPLESAESDFVLKREIEFWAESLSIHYAVDVNPSGAFVEMVQKRLEGEYASLAEIVIESCGLDISVDSEDEDDGRGKELCPSVVEAGTLVDSTQPPALSQQPFSQQTFSQQTFSQQTFSQQTAMSPLTLNSHWSRLRSKTLRRRSTDTDLSKLVDLPPMPPRLSQTSSFSQATPKRKGVLVHVGDLVDEAGQKAEVVAFETPVKLRRASTMNSAASQSQSTQTEPSLVILETPPRASLGAAMAIRVDTSVSKFSIS